LALCVGLSFEICHNGICDEDRCGSDDDCPSCFSCDTKCGTCKTIPNCCMSHQVCPDWDGVCDAEENPTTCNYCNSNEHLCEPGCVDNTNCEAGSECIGHQCRPVETCTDDASCNNGEATPICDIENSPYTTCFYCEGGECKPGCVTDANCPSDYKCSQDHICGAPPGKVLIQSITVRTKTGCSDCSKEGVTLSLRGEKNANAVDGVPCSTKTLDHSGTTDYDGSNGSAARFDGTLNGAENDAERTMMGGCYQAPLNAQLFGGTMVWQGSQGWAPRDICVDWMSDNFAWQCSTTSTGANSWDLVNCHDLTPLTKCDDLTMTYMV